MIKDQKTSGCVRDVTRRTHRGRRALAFFSQKNSDLEVRVESGLELDVGLFLESDPRVLKYAAQPFFLELVTGRIFQKKEDCPKISGSKPRWYTPDFLCRMHDGSQLAIDAKHSNFHKRFDKRRPEITAALKQLGIGFCVIAEDAMEPYARFNLCSMHGLRAPCYREFVATAIGEINKLLEQNQIWRSVDLATHLSGGRPAVLAGILSGLLSANLRRPLFDAESELAASYGDLSHFILLELPNDGV